MIEVLRVGYAWLTLSLGFLGAGLAICLLTLIPADAASTAYNRLMDEPLPNVVFVGAIGFAAGALVAALWSLARRFMADVR